MTEAGSDLSFERAEYENASSNAMPCSSCSNPLEHQYWKWQQKLLCDACRQRTEQGFKDARSSASFGKAVALGGLAALGCGIAYGIFVAVTDIQIALATIGIAFVIARVVRMASQGLGGTRYQVLAVALTYSASAMGYAPAIWQGLRAAEGGAKRDANETAQGDSVVPAPSADLAAQKTEAEPAKQRTTEAKQASDVGILQVVLAFAFLFGLTMIAPFLAFTAAPIGFLIVLFGLWEAWKLSKGTSTEIEGPYQVATSTSTAPV